MGAGSENVCFNFLIDMDEMQFIMLVFMLDH